MNKRFGQLTIIIPTHNRKSELESLLLQLYDFFSQHEAINVIVIVDGSKDGTLEMMANKFPDVHVVHGDGSWWYTKSMNEGFKYACKFIDTDFFLTLNDDVYLAEDYIIEVLKISQEIDNETIVGSFGLTIKKPHRVVFSGNRYKNKILSLYSQHLPFLSEVNPRELSGMYSSITLPGRGVLIPSSILEALNGFDENFKQYHSDGDFALRAKKKGYKVKINWDMKIFISLEQTSDTTSYLNKSFLVLLKSYFNPVSRNYLPDKARYIWRHSYKILFPFKFILFLLLSIKNIYLKTKI